MLPRGPCLVQSNRVAQSYTLDSPCMAFTVSLAWLPDGDSRIFRLYVLGPSGFWTMAPLCYTAKFDPFFSLDCAPTPSTLAQSRKGSNCDIWQPCSLSPGLAPCPPAALKLSLPLACGLAPPLFSVRFIAPLLNERRYYTDERRRRQGRARS